MYRNIKMYRNMKMYTIYYTLQLSQHHSYFEFFLPKLVLVWACILHGTTSSARYYPPPVFGTCKQFQFFPFCSSAVFCLLSCMGRVFYLLPSSIWVDVPSLTNVWNTHQDLSSHFTKEGRGILYISARGYVAGYLIRYANIVPRTRLLENPVRG